jgi:Na+-driven multidrug efflux pump
MVPVLGRGIAGAAWATTGSQIGAAGLLLNSLVQQNLLRPSAIGKKVWSEAVRPIISFAPFVFVMIMKMTMHNSAAVAAASLGGAQAAAHTAIFALGMLCFTFGDVGSSLSQAFLPVFSREVVKEDGKTKMEFDLEAARPSILKVLQVCWCVSATVIALSSAVVLGFAGQITCDAAVIGHMRRALPLLALSLAMHASAVTLEGLLLAQGKQKQLVQQYGVLTATIVALHTAIQKGVGGLRPDLLSVWGVYVW